MKKFIYPISILLVALGIFLILKKNQSPLEFMSPDDSFSSQDSIQHSIPLDEILDGGPGKDGIPSIDTPKFLSIDEATYLNPDDPGIGVIIGNDARFYPYRILVWHEIVNDIVGGQPVAVTYCPLCATGVVYDRTIDGGVVEFGVSGKLWQSNLLMYDRQDNSQDESYWSQVLGQAVVGPATGVRLDIVSSQIVTAREWFAAHPDAQVLAPPTDVLRNYNRQPYGDYDTSDAVFFPVNNTDDRLHPKDLVAGIEIDDVFIAVDLEAIHQRPTTFNIKGNDMVAMRDENNQITVTVNGQEDYSHIIGFWFSWVAVHPETELVSDITS